MSPGARRPHQVRAYLETELYERVLREAGVQRQSVSECIHEALEELYAIRDELSRPLETSTAEGTEPGRWRTGSSVRWRSGCWERSADSSKRSRSWARNCGGSR